MSCLQPPLSMGHVIHATSRFNHWQLRRTLHVLLSDSRLGFQVLLADLCVALARLLYSACPILIFLFAPAAVSAHNFSVRGGFHLTQVLPFILCRETDRSMRTSCYTGSNVIVMQLDRHHMESRQKYQEHMAFPDELDMLPWMHPESSDLAEGCSVVYDLACIIVLKGRDHAMGHNIAVCRLGPGEGICQLVTSWVQGLA